MSDSKSKQMQISDKLNRILLNVIATSQQIPYMDIPGCERNQRITIDR